MMQPQLLQPSLQSYNMCSLPDDYSYDSEISLNSDFSALFPDVFTEFTSSQNDAQLQDKDFATEDVSPSEFDDVCKWLNIIDTEETTDAASSPSFSVLSFDEASTARKPANLLNEFDTRESLDHLLLAYGEAKENGLEELAEVIAKRVKGKGNPLGETMERVAHRVFECGEDREEDYLRRESSKVFEQAFRAFYLIHPCGRFAHFAANSAILEALPSDAESIRVVDFDIREGIQWPPMIEAMASKRKALTLRLTSVKSEEESGCNRWRFEETKRQLYTHAKPFGLKLQIEEMTIKELLDEAKQGTEKEWIAFNCMFRLPHMTPNRQTANRTLEFLRIAKEVLTSSAARSGVIILADGESEGCENQSSGFGSFFNRRMAHYKSLLKSMEWHFPYNLSEARIALENLFLVPRINSGSWYHDWTQNKTRKTSDFQAETGLICRAISRENLLQAKELVNERGTPYRVGINEQKPNEMILEWKGTPLIRVSTWM